VGVLFLVCRKVEDVVALSQRRTQLLGRLRHRKTREREGLVLVEGLRAVSEALAAGAETTFVVSSPRLTALDGGTTLLEVLASRGVEADLVDDKTMAGLADTENSQGVLLVCRQPAPDRGSVSAGSRTLVLDALQDPGNVGTLVRAATAFALDAVVVLDGSADPWGAKAVRSSAGTSFRLPILQMKCEEALSFFGEQSVPLLVADASGDRVTRWRSPSGWALVVGNEGAGPREALVSAATAVVSVPMPGPAESLNAGVAGSILLYALTQEDAGAQ
jgi:TrmH family RNA methyltransferase